MRMNDPLDIAAAALREFVAADVSGWSKIAIRREAWPETSARIVGALKEVGDKQPASDRGLHVLATLKYKHFGTVQLQFGHAKTGIVEQVPGRTSMGVERGASLVFGQSESGLIAVQRYPFRTELPGDSGGAREPDFVEAFEPSALDRERVLALTAAFFTWALGTTISHPDARSKGRIGFSPPFVVDGLTVRETVPLGRVSRAVAKQKLARLVAEAAAG